MCAIYLLCFTTNFFLYQIPFKNRTSEILPLKIKKKISMFIFEFGIRATNFFKSNNFFFSFFFHGIYYSHQRNGRIIIIKLSTRYTFPLYWKTVRFILPIPEWDLFECFPFKAITEHQNPRNVRKMMREQTEIDAY